MRPAYILSEFRRVFRQYWMGAVSDARARPLALPGAIGRLLLARLRYGVGPKYYCLYRLSRVPRSEWGNYITDDPKFKAFLADRNSGGLSVVVSNKLAFHQHCVTVGLPTIPVLCVVSKDHSFKAYGSPVVDGLDHWRTVMRDAPGDLFIKTIDGTYGEGAFTARISGEVVEFDGCSGTLDELFAHLLDKLGDQRGWLVQPRYFTHPEMLDVASPHGLATVRAVTQYRNGKAEFLIADLKITVGESVIDNFHQGETGNLLAGVDLATGRLTAGWGSTRKDWPEIVEVTRHPDTGATIAGSRLPLWNELVSLVLRAQESLPNLRTLGWDVAITRKGVVIVEANSGYDVSILQVAHQRGLKREFLEALA